MTLREIFISLGLDFDSAGFAAADIAASAVKKGMELLGEAVLEVGKQLATAVTKTVDTASHLDDMSKRTGIATDTLQTLGFAAEQNGSSMQELAMGLQFLSRNAVAASKGGKESASAFARLGISTRDSNGALKNSEQLLMEVADGLKGMPDGVEKTALAVQLLGRSGTQLLPTLAGGAAGLRAAKEEAEALGLVLDERTVAAGDNLGNNFGKLTGIVDSLRAALAGPLMDALNELIGSPKGGGFLGWYATHKDLIKSKLVEYGKTLANVLKSVARIVGSLAGGFVFLLKQWRLVAVILGTVVLAALLAQTSAIAGLVTWYGALAVASIRTAIASAAAWLAAAAPMLLLAALIALVAIAAQDVYMFLTGGDSLIGTLGPKFTKFLDEFSGGHKKDDPWWLTALRNAVGFVTDLGNTIPKALGDVRVIMNDFFVWVMDQALKVGNVIVRSLTAGMVGMDQNSLSGGAKQAITGMLFGGNPTGFASLFGGGASPATSAAASDPKVLAPNMRANISITMPPGADGAAAGTEVKQSLDEWFGGVLRGAFNSGG